MPRDYFPGMGQAVADRTINRGDEGWGDVARRVAFGNSAMKGGEDQDELEYHIGRGTILMSGRHLQHGDETQPDRNIEVFANCSTSAQRALGFYLLLNGSGVGSSYDDALMVVDFRNMPEVINVIDEDHADVLNGMITGYQTLADIRKPCTVFRVPDSREGWAQALEEVENAAWAADKAGETLVLDWSGVRPYGSPIAGMQGRPSSGPCAVMESISKVALIKYQKDMQPWRQAMQIDHHMAECVLVGGARRAARIAVKIWSDPGILDFIRSKEDGDLWSANHSIGVDVEFWRQDTAFKREVLAAATHVQYHGGKGEPGFLNLDMLSHGETRPTLGDVEKMAGKYQLTPAGLALRRALARAAGDMKYFNIVNPCGEIRLNATGGYCVIADVVPYHAADDDEAMEAFSLATRALLRTNMQTAMYQGEVDRTNRIGVGMTGFHEYAWQRFELGWKGMLEVDPSGLMIEDANGALLEAPSAAALPLWNMVSDFADAVDEACWEWGGVFPASRRTFKPAGTTSKLFGLTEGAHLPPMLEYLRWVQYRSDSPLLPELIAAGYPTRVLETYKGVTIVGFPTQPVICTLGMGDELVTAPNATPAEHFRFLRLLETYWLKVSGGNQISYTLKYDPRTVTYDEYQATIMDNMPKVRAVAVMPFGDTSGYEYLPEEEVSAARFAELVARIEGGRVEEDIGREHVECSTGACPITFN
jgi:adenosylcobalamin-dependent ribonucleoside-triphosphate reductase